MIRTNLVEKGKEIGLITFGKGLLTEIIRGVNKNYMNGKNKKK